MELTKRITYLSFLLIGIVFVLIGLALNETDIIAKVNAYDFNQWYSFLETWVGNEFEDGFTQGLPTPWEP
jgi:hypothetical protein